MTKIHLVRHGQTDWNLEKRMQGQSDSQLTDLGREQAQQLCEKFDCLVLDAVYSSTSVRAHDTTKIILNGRKTQIEGLDSLREINLGDWEGKLYSDIKNNDPDGFSNFWDDPSQFKCNGAETVYELQERAVTAFHAIVNDNRGKEVLIVSHGGWIKALLAHFEGRPIKSLWAPPRIDNCGHSIIEEVEEGCFEIRMFSGLTEW